MAQEMINQYKLELKKKSETKSTQTGELEFMVYLDRTKTMRMYYSESYKDYVLCLHFSNNKRYIITKNMWKIFRKYIELINHVLNR